LGLIEQLLHKTVCIDTAPFIYYIERHSTYGKIAKVVFEYIEQGEIFAITSNISLLEVMVHPFRIGDNKLAGEYRDILMNSEGLKTYSIDIEISENAARLRAKYNIRTPDALQIATAITGNADIFLTNDQTLKKISEIKVLCLSD
jgi:predicted nucleic acid-binding protein